MEKKKKTHSPCWDMQISAAEQHDFLFENRRRKVGNAGRLWTSEPWDLWGRTRSDPQNSKSANLSFHQEKQQNPNTVPAKITDQVYQEYTSPQLIQYLEEEIFQKTTFY